MLLAGGCLGGVPVRVEGRQNIPFPIFSRWESWEGAEELHGNLWALLPVTDADKRAVLILKNESLIL